MGSISISAQCIETQLMPNEGLESLSDLQITYRSFSRKVTPSWHNLHRIVPLSITLFLFFSFFWPHFRHLSVNACSTIPDFDEIFHV